MPKQTSFTFVAPRASIAPEPSDKEKLRVNVSHMSLAECLALLSIASKAAVRLQQEVSKKRTPPAKADDALKPERKEDAS